MKYFQTGTDDDLPNQCLVRTPRGILFTGALRIISGPVDCEKESHMDFQIHCIETEAYGAVLKAFIAQSEVLSWVYSLTSFFCLCPLE